MRPLKAFLFLTLLAANAAGQTNIISTNPVALQVLKGNYDPAQYMASTILNRHDTIAKGINAGISTDSLYAYLTMLGTFHNRNTSSDTISALTGIGAARRWVYSKFMQYSAAHQNRLIASYLQFDQLIGNMNQHRDVFAVLPGMDTADKSVIIIEGHIDSRCKDVNDTGCLAQGIEDNGSGTALVMELARVMSRFSYNHTIVFVCTIGEEQGLYGAAAFALYCQQQGIAVKAVFNNDIVGGIICGYTSSAPSCPGFGNIDSTHVRLFSLGGFNSLHKQLARFIKLEYKEDLLQYVSVPMSLMIMSAEDRTGRGGDHQPFRQRGYTSMRFVSANEDGDANVTDTAYKDRQHTSGDVLGLDTNNDNVIDTFFVDMDYLSRNVAINGAAAGMIAIGPQTPDFSLSNSGGFNMVVQITQQQQYLHYRVGVRTTTNDWDSVYTFSGKLTDTISLSGAGNYIVSVASVDSAGVESLFSEEKMLNITGINEMKQTEKEIILLQNQPNPLDEVTNINVYIAHPGNYKEAFIRITDISGKEITRINMKLEKGMNEVQYNFSKQPGGTYFYTLVVDGKEVTTRKMVVGK